MSTYGGFDGMPTYPEGSGILNFLYGRDVTNPVMNLRANLLVLIPMIVGDIRLLPVR